MPRDASHETVRPKPLGKVFSSEKSLMTLYGVRSCGDFTRTDIGVAVASLRHSRKDPDMREIESPTAAGAHRQSAAIDRQQLGSAADETSRYRRAIRRYPTIGMQNPVESRDCSRRHWFGFRTARLRID